MSKLTIVAKVVARKNSIEKVKNELLSLVEPTRKENGCQEYRLHQDNDDPAVFIFYEIWKNQLSLEQHLRSRHYLDYLAAVDGFLAHKLVQKMTGIEAGLEECPF